MRDIPMIEHEMVWPKWQLMEGSHVNSVRVKYSTGFLSSTSSPMTVKGLATVVAKQDEVGLWRCEFQFMSTPRIYSTEVFPNWQAARKHLIMDFIHEAMIETVSRWLG